MALRVHAACPIRLSQVVFLFLSAAVSTASAQWTVVSLHPAASTYSEADGVSTGEQVGYAILDVRRASLWRGTAASRIELHPSIASSSKALATNAGQQGGEAVIGGYAHASLWSGTAASWVDLNPIGMAGSGVAGLNGGQQVGRTFDGGSTHAALWTGTEASWVDLNPSGSPKSEALGVGGGRQVGFAYAAGLQVASLWSGTAASWINLSPGGAIESSARAVNGMQQAGYAKFGSAIHAVLWTGTASSWVDLNPAGSFRSYANGVDGGQQVGEINIAGHVRASLWSGTAASWVDLHAFLPANFNDSSATGIWHDVDGTHVVGWGGNNTVGHGVEAVLWTLPPPPPCITAAEVSQLLANDGALHGHFGAATAVSGDTAVIGTYIFTRAPGGATWTQQAKLTVPDGITGFLTSWVAISGDTVVIGAPVDNTPGGANAGSAYIFTRAHGGTTWTQQARLVAPDGAANDQFGQSVAISGDTALIGANYDDTAGGSNTGSAYVFTRPPGGTAWTQQSKLTASDGAAEDGFGWSVALAGDTAVIGALFANTPGGIDAGSAYVFTRTSGGTAWAQQAKLTAADGALEDSFGYSVAIAGDTVVIGANQDDSPGAINAGSAYVFARTPGGATWTQQSKLTAFGGAVSLNFGASVAIAGDTAVIGSYLDDTAGGTRAGSAYIFSRAAGGTWAAQARLTASDGAASDYFGYSVAIGGDAVLVGADGNDTSGGLEAGSVYAFALTTRGPTISAQPIPVTACPSTTGTFSFSATGESPFTYQWRKGTVPINTMTNASASTPTLILANVQSPDAGLYDCIITNGCGSATSSPASLTVGIAGDMNGDYAVNTLDLTALLSHFGQSVAAGTQGDINFDGAVNTLDLIALLWAFGQSC